MNSDTAAKIDMPDYLRVLPDRVWYLTSTGTDMWCRRPYGFFFTSSESAQGFALRMGTSLALSPIGVASKELVSKEGIEAMRKMLVTRIFVDPEIDDDSGDVFGTILRIDSEAKAN